MGLSPWVRRETSRAPQAGAVVRAVFQGRTLHHTRSLQALPFAHHRQDAALSGGLSLCPVACQPAADASPALANSYCWLMREEISYTKLHYCFLESCFCWVTGIDPL